MRIEDKRTDSKKPLRDIKEGTVILYNKEFFIRCAKTSTSFPDGRKEISCASIKEGYIITLYEGTYVKEYPNSKVVIE